MFRSLKKLSQKIYDDSKPGRFVLNLLGEVIMIVAGILIALAIDNWTSARKDKAQLNDILTLIKEDMINDTTEVGMIGRIVDEDAELFFKLAAGEYSKEELRECIKCQGLLLVYPITNIEKRGYTQLTSISDKFQGDSLLADISLFYSTTIKILETYEQHVADDIGENKKYWRDNYDWYGNFVLRDDMEGYLNYMLNDPDYINRLAHHNWLLNSEYLVSLDEAYTQFQRLLPAIDSRLQKEGRIPPNTKAAP